MPEEKKRAQTIAMGATADSSQTTITHFISLISSAILIDAKRLSNNLSDTKRQYLIQFSDLMI
jgi:hypothetical protein